MNLGEVPLSGAGANTTIGDPKNVLHFWGKGGGNDQPNDFAEQVKSKAYHFSPTRVPKIISVSYAVLESK